MACRICPFKICPLGEISPLRIAVIYLVVSWLWILSSDSLLHMVVGDPDTEATLQSVKGIVFVGVTAFMLYLLSAAMVAKVRQEIDEHTRTKGEIRKLATALDICPVSVMITDLDGAIEYVNPKFTEVSGYTAQEVVGRNPSVFKSGLNPPELYRDLWRCIQSGREWHGELHNRRKNGELYWESILISAIKGPDGTITHYLAVKEDITDRLQAQAQLIQASKLATLGEMATAMAHELNQPLNVIKMAADSSIERIEDGRFDAEFAHGKLKRISAQIDRAAAIIDHMRIFGRTDDGTPRPFDPVDCATAALDLMGEQLRLREIEVETRFPKHCRKVLGHPAQLEQVLLNLIGNARDAIEMNDQAPDRPRKITVAVEDSSPEDGIKLIVRDSGGGIPEQIAPFLFEPFFTTKEAGKGTGLGLSISQQIVSKMDGKIEAADNGDGAKFTITLPVASDYEKAA